MPRFGWPEKHGEKRREEIRRFRREEAGALAKARMAEIEREQLGATALAKARMAEIEREQLGATRRRGLMEAGETERRRMQETGLWTRGREAERGLEARHLREFGPEGIRAQVGKWRFAPGGLEERTAAGRLSEAMIKGEEKKAIRAWEIQRNKLLGGYLKDGVLPDSLEAVRWKAEEAENITPGSGRKILEEGLKKYEEEDRLFSESLLGMSLDEMKNLRGERLSR